MVDADPVLVNAPLFFCFCSRENALKGKSESTRRGEIVRTAIAEGRSRRVTPCSCGPGGFDVGAASSVETLSEGIFFECLSDKFEYKSHTIYDSRKTEYVILPKNNEEQGCEALGACKF